MAKLMFNEEKREGKLKRMYIAKNYL